MQYGCLHILSLTDAKNAGFAVVPLYTYNAAVKAQAAFDAGTFPGEDTGEGLPGTLSRPVDDHRLVFAVPQGNLGVQIAEVATYGHDVMTGPGRLEMLPVEQVPALGEGLVMLNTLAAAIRGDVPHVLVSYQKDGEEPTLRRLRPLQFFPTKRSGVARHNWPIVVLCDDLDKGENGKTFLLSRMRSVAFPPVLTDQEAAELLF